MCPMFYVKAGFSRNIRRELVVHVNYVFDGFAFMDHHKNNWFLHGYQILYRIAFFRLPIRKTLGSTVIPVTLRPGQA